MVDKTEGVKIDNCFQRFAASAEYSYLRPCRSPPDGGVYVRNVLWISVINLVADTKHISRQIIVFQTFKWLYMHTINGEVTEETLVYKIRPSILQIILLFNTLCFCRFSTMGESMVRGRNLLCYYCSNSIHPWVCWKLRRRQTSCMKPLKGRECEPTELFLQDCLWECNCARKSCTYVGLAKCLLCRALLLDEPGFVWAGHDVGLQLLLVAWVKSVTCLVHPRTLPRAQPVRG